MHDLAMDEIDDLKKELAESEQRRLETVAMCEQLREERQNLEIMVACCRNLFDRTHYLCERCGGMGLQEEGCYNADRKAYDDPAGICNSCGGCGYLGVG